MRKYKHVNFLWDNEKADNLNNDEISLLLYRSNLLGSDLRITNYGGGNTSCKTFEIDPIQQIEKEVLWIKGSGGDLASMKRNGLAGLDLSKVLDLKKIYKGLSHEDEMVELLNYCIFDLNSKAPSIDTPLHAFLPFKHIDHLHPDAVIAIAASKDGEKITKEIFGDKIGWIPWQRPGFDLGLKLFACLQENPNIIGIILESHGLFTWGDTSFNCYLNTLDVIERCSEFIDEKHKNLQFSFGGQKRKTEHSSNKNKILAKLTPLIRGLCSNEGHLVGHFSDDNKVLDFVNSNDFERLAKLGTSCPDHFLRTKISPLIVDILQDAEDFSDETLQNYLSQKVTDYRKKYTEYYETCKRKDSPLIRNSNPVVILIPGIGMYTFAKDKATARISAEFYINAINVMRGAETISEYKALPIQEAFDIEYWQLEEAKLRRMPKPLPLTGKIALITGSGGGIGKAIAKKYLENGACVVLSDNNVDRLHITYKEFSNIFGKDTVGSVVLDVTNVESIEVAFEEILKLFGGIDIVVNNAGISISKPIEKHTTYDFNLLYDILVKGQFFVTQKAAEIMKMQNIGGDIINVVSKNALVSSPNNAAYGSAKAAQLHLSRLSAAELGQYKIKVNVVNPDAVIEGSNIWSSGWAEGRAKAYGITVEELPKYYANRTLLNEIILTEDIANACLVFVSGYLNKSTGNVINVDGGIASAFVR